MYRDYKTQIDLSSILQCTGTITHRLTFLLSYSVQGLYIQIPDIHHDCIALRIFIVHAGTKMIKLQLFHVNLHWEADSVPLNA